jgi:hypothetical protein
MNQQNLMFQQNLNQENKSLSKNDSKTITSIYKVENTLVKSKKLKRMKHQLCYCKTKSGKYIKSKTYKNVYTNNDVKKNKNNLNKKTPKETRNTK